VIRNILRWLLAPLILASFAAAGCGTDRRPNVILLVVDTLRADHVSAYGYPRETTPVLDRLFAEGVRFDAAISPSSWSATSHASIITGTLPHQHGVREWGGELAAETPPLTTSLKSQGYATGLFSTHRSFHETIAGVQADLDVSYVRRGTVTPEHPPYDRTVLERAAAWAAEQTDPYFLWAVIVTPHAPYTRYPEDWNDRYFTDTPEGGERRYPFGRNHWLGLGEIPGSVREGDHDEVGYYVNRYDRSVRYADQLIGELLDSLRASGRLENTLLVVTSDHGEGFGDHDVFAHGLYLYDFLVRVPLLVHYPGVVAGGQLWRQPVGLVDLAPTILGLVGAEPPLVMRGVDHSADLVAGREPAPGRVVLGAYQEGSYDRYMVRSQTHKLLYDAVEGRMELYDLGADPAEVNDLLAAGSVGSEVLGPLTEELQELLEKHRQAGRLRGATPIPPHLVEELRALGYLVPDEAPAD
jgi:arylsulfatase A-like enzyme